MVTLAKGKAVTLYEVAETYVGTKEVGGQVDNPQVLAWLKLDDPWPEHDEVPWCSSFLNGICKPLRLPRSKSKLARSWLGIGRPVSLGEAQPGFDVVILKRGSGDQPGPENMTAPGHVGLFSGVDSKHVYLLGGNQSNQVCVAPFPKDRVLGIRRLWEYVDPWIRGRGDL